tara:strand:+ start:170 stop:580 length:411 start_codon:yes stop_codon:yes gene_type:complete
MSESEAEAEEIKKDITEEFKEVVINYVKTDDDIRKKMAEIKELKDEKKEYETFILEYMDKINENVINISDGKLRMNKSKTKAPLKEENIQSAIFSITNNEEQSLQLTKHIFQNRPLTERVNLKRTKNRKEKKNKNI